MSLPGDACVPADGATSAVSCLPLLSSHCTQSSPNSSTGCWVRTVPFPQRRSSAEQYLSQPQQIRSGCLGLSASFGFERFVCRSSLIVAAERTINSEYCRDDDFCHSLSLRLTSAGTVGQLATSSCVWSSSEEDRRTEK